MDIRLSLDMPGKGKNRPRIRTTSLDSPRDAVLDSAAEVETDDENLQVGTSHLADVVVGVNSPDEANSPTMVISRVREEFCRLAFSKAARTDKVRQSLISNCGSWNAPWSK